MMKDKKTKKFLNKRWWSILIVSIMMIGFIVSCEESKSDTAKMPTSEQIISELTESLQGKIGENESITGITLVDEVMTILVDLSNAKPEYFSVEELAVSRASGITDRILSYPEFDSSWNKVIIDFGDIGKVICDKSMILEDEVFGRYFDIPENYLD